MFKVDVKTVEFTQKIQRYQQMTGKAMGVVVKEQARLLSERLTKLTFPTTKAQGRKRVAIDIGRVYLASKWFEDIFRFRNQKLGDRIKNATYSKDESTLTAIFEKSPRLNRIRIEAFDRNRHKNLRRGGRVLVPNPFSFPLAQESQVNSLLKEKQANVGLAKRGWANCTTQLGKGVPGWLSKGGAGEVIDKSGETTAPYVVLCNKVGFFAAMDARNNIVRRALEGRGRDMIKSAENQLREAAHKAGFDSR